MEKNRKTIKEYSLSDKYGNHSAPENGNCTHNAHCGAPFRPDASTFHTYAPAGTEYVGHITSYEGIFSILNADNWAWKLPRIICALVSSEGITSRNHATPYYRATSIGMGFFKNSEFVSTGNERHLVKGGCGELRPGIGDC